MSNSSAGLKSQSSDIVVPELDDTRFEILNPIGSGGMGTVYRALQRSVGRQVAVKILAPEHAANALGLARFVREANAIARIVHPNIVQIFDFGRNPRGQLLLVMELLEGESLRAMLRREKVVEPTRAVYIASECLKALRAAHGAGVIHRDLKPENIFLQQTSADDRIKVLDFGVAKLTHGDPGESNTTAGSLVGTLRYMPPEQVAGEAADARVDIYSIGMVLYEMLSGTMPYETRDRFVLMRQIIVDPPVQLSETAPHLRPELCDVVMRAISKTARERFDDADAFRRALIAFMDPSMARAETLSERSSRPAQRASIAPEPAVEYRSGVVRSSEFQGPVAHPKSTTPTPKPPSNSNPAPGTPTQNETSEDSLEVFEPPRRVPRVWLVTVVFLGVILAALAGIATHALVSRPQPSGRLPGVSTVNTRPSVPVPVLVAPVSASRLVVLDSRPPGALVSDLSGHIVCSETPCSLRVPAGEELALRVSLEGRAVNAVIDGTERTVTLDLPPPVEPPARPPPRPHRPHNGPPAQRPVEELPMFLPHAAR